MNGNRALIVASKIVTPGNLTTKSFVFVIALVVVLGLSSTSTRTIRNIDKALLMSSL